MKIASRVREEVHRNKGKGVLAGKARQRVTHKNSPKLAVETAILYVRDLNF
jgi:hypothetical protein